MEWSGVEWGGGSKRRDGQLMMMIIQISALRPGESGVEEEGEGRKQTMRDKQEALFSLSLSLSLPGLRCRKVPSDYTD